jgi:ABC-2 type transport system ATP-binding protein
MRNLGKKQLTLHLHKRLETIPDSLVPYQLMLGKDGHELTYSYDTQGERTGITRLLDELAVANIRFKDLHTTQSSLEEIFIDLVKR